MPSALSTEAIHTALNGRVDQRYLKLAIEDLVRPHFYETPEDRIRDVAVMLRDLAEFSDDVARWAVREWRLNETRRPTSATLRQLCMVRRHALTEEAKRRDPPQEPEPPYKPATPEQLAERKAIFDRIAASNGFVKERSGRWSFPEDVKQPERVKHWSETAAADDPRHAQVRAARIRAGIINSAPEPF